MPLVGTKACECSPQHFLGFVGSTDELHVRAEIADANIIFQEDARDPESLRLKGLGLRMLVLHAHPCTTTNSGEPCGF